MIFRLGFSFDDENIDINVKTSSILVICGGSFTFLANISLNHILSFNCFIIDFLLKNSPKGTKLLVETFDKFKLRGWFILWVVNRMSNFLTGIILETESAHINESWKIIFLSINSQMNKFQTSAFDPVLVHSHNA